MRVKQTDEVLITPPTWIRSGTSSKHAKFILRYARILLSILHGSH